MYIIAFIYRMSEQKPKDKTPLKNCLQFDNNIIIIMTIKFSMS